MEKSNKGRIAWAKLPEKPEWMSRDRWHDLYNEAEYMEGSQAFHVGEGLTKQEERYFWDVLVYDYFDLDCCDTCGTWLASYEFYDGTLCEECHDEEEE